MSRELVLGAADQLIRPDAIENYGATASIESGVRIRVIGREWRPAGQEGQVIARRILVSGYSRAKVQLYATPIVDGRFRNELRRYFSKPAPRAGRLEAFSFILPLRRTHPDYPGRLFGVKGSSFSCMVELVDPNARVYLTAVTFAHQKKAPLRARGVREGGGQT